MLPGLQSWPQTNGWKGDKKKENNEKVCVIADIDHEPDGIYINRVAEETNVYF